ncbi:hypothetical protein HELRODRAFT_130955, partial [Helobdella robusta]|uniref:Large subunit GTPase 1 homolog n=1 Tax=Helobdella robusta TaxID=6412 RepID=T1EHU8_HELRO
LHTTDLNDGLDWNKINFRSITEENTLEEFLSTAELAMTEFIAERENSVLISCNNLVPSAEESAKMQRIQNDLKSLLRIPRRPKWDEQMNIEQLNENEKTSFLEWRHDLSKLSEMEGILITPYEKNLEFWRQLWRVIEKSDVIVQIVDARNPLLFRCEDLEIYVKEIDPKKENVLLINKADFLNESQRKIWVDYFKDFEITVLFWSAIKELKEKGIVNDINKSIDETEYEANPILNASQLLDWFKYIGRKIKKDCDELITVGLIGYPNVGKSSTINALLAHRTAPVSATPGKTKHFQTFFIDSQLLLCDCPGLVMPNFVASKAEMVTNGILPVDQMKDYLSPTAIVCNLISKTVFEQTYGIILEENTKSSPYDLLTAYARVRGFMTHKGVPDCSRAARLIIKDFVNGKLCYCACPP